MLTLVYMNKVRIIVAFLFLAVGVVSCNKNNVAPDKPEIALLSVEPTTVKNGAAFDTVKISLRYTMDPDQIGDESSDVKVILRDSRDSTDQNIIFPSGINLENLDNKVVTGTITLSLAANPFFILADPQTADTIQYRIFLENKDNITSNIVTTPEIIVVP